MLGGVAMTIYEFEGKLPVIGEGAYVFPSADVIGDVTIGKHCYIGPGARLRGDYGTIIIGSGTSIEDNCVVHARPGEICTIGNRVTIGHGSVIHNCVINDSAIIGMGSVISDYAEVGIWAVIAEGAVVTNKTRIPNRSIAAGIPAKVIGNIGEEYIKTWTEFKEIYEELATTRYPSGLKSMAQ